MYLNVLCDGYNPFFADVCEKIFFDGYDIKTTFVNGYVPKDESIKYMERSLPEDKFTQLSFCHPSNLTKNFSAQNSIGFIDHHHCPMSKECLFYLNMMDKIIVTDVLTKNHIIKLGVSEGKISVINYYGRKIPSRTGDSSKITFGYYYDGDRSALSDVIVSYLETFEDREGVRLAIGANGGSKEVRRDINMISGMHDMGGDVLNSITVYDTANFSKLSTVSDCIIFTQNDNRFNRRVLDCMRSGISVIVPQSTVYFEYCKMNNSYIYLTDDDSGVRLDSISDCMLSVYGDEEKRIIKMVIAKDASENIFSESKFYESLYRILSEAGMVSYDVEIPMHRVYDKNSEILI
jgi:hypothetical protein